ncbi:hypothetical protein CW304_23980 [Bacillus sp. UFRGS-B20]|nr:hypothetical protein CW304_23980 [Bacillus sp. UFRGS-B20]
MWQLFANSKGKLASSSLPVRFGIVYVYINGGHVFLVGNSFKSFYDRVGLVPLNKGYACWNFQGIVIVQVFRIHNSANGISGACDVGSNKAFSRCSFSGECLCKARALIHVLKATS